MAKSFDDWLNSQRPSLVIYLKDLGRVHIMNLLKEAWNDGYKATKDEEKEREKYTLHSLTND